MNITKLLHGLEAGDQDVMNTLMPMVYGELKKLARSNLRRELNARPLETTALVHEAFLKLAGSRHPSYENRSHFFGIASRLMRQVLIDTARAKATEKRASAQEIAMAELPEAAPQWDRSLLALEVALEWLEKTDPQKGRLIEMRYFAGMTAEECAAALSLPVYQVRRDLRLARAQLKREMTGTHAAA